MEPTKHQYDYDAATVHGFLSGTVSRAIKLNIEANHATLAGHTLRARGRLRRRQRDARHDRHQPRRPAERLGHRPVPEFGRRADVAVLRDPQARRVRDGWLQLRRQAASPEHRPDRPLPRPHRRDRHARAGPPRSGEDDPRETEFRWRRCAKDAMPAGRATLWASQFCRRRYEPGAARAQRRFWRGRSAARASGHQEMLENLVNQHVWASEREPIETSAGR